MTSPRSRTFIVALFALLSAPLLSACEPAADPGSDDVESVSAALAVVPADAKCLHVIAVGSRTVAKSIGLTAGSGVTLDLGKLPVGTVSFSASAWNAVCPSTTTPPSGDPTWIADPLVQEIVLGAKNVVKLTLRASTPTTGTVDFVNATQSVALTFYATLALMQDGTVKGWGTSYYGELGENTGIARLAPIPLAGLSGVKQLVAGHYHACAVLGDKTARCWGFGSNGRLGNGATMNSNVPVVVQGLSNVEQISAGASHTCAVTTDRSLYCWGYNGSGQLGDATTSTRLVPVLVSDNTVAVAAGSNHTCSVSGSGIVYCAGYNGHGQLGTGDFVNRTYFVGGASLTAATNVAAGTSHTCALRADETVHCWGAATQLGDGTASNRSSAGLVPLPAAVRMVVAGDSHTCVALSSGATRCWGSGEYGQLGDGTGKPWNTPVVPRGLADDTVTVHAGPRNACAVSRTGAVRCWGYNVAGQLGDGTTVFSRFVPGAYLNL